MSETTDEHRSEFGGVEEICGDNSDGDVKIIFHSLNPQLSLQIFFEQLFFHLFYPFSIPFLFWKYGRTFPIAHGVFSTFPLLILSNWIFPSFFVLAIVTSQFLPSQIGDGFIVPSCIFLIHRFMIATKYATMSESEYAEYLDLNRPGGIFSPPRPDYKATLSSYQFQLQILSSWAHLTPEIIAFELHAAAKKLEINLEHVLFYVPIPHPSSNSSATSNSNNFTSTQYQFDLWKQFLQEDDLISRYPHLTIPSSSPSSANDYLCINSFKVCQALLNHCNAPIFSSLFSVSIFISLTFAFIPILFIFLYPSRFSPQAISPSLLPLFLLFHLSCFMLNSILFNALVAILLVCITDAYRKLRIFTFLSTLIRANDVDMDLMHVTSSGIIRSGISRRNRRNSTTPLSTGHSSKPHLPSGKLGKLEQVHPSGTVAIASRPRRRKASILLPNRSEMPPTPMRSAQELDQVQSIQEEENPKDSSHSSTGKSGAEARGKREGDEEDEDSKDPMSSSDVSVIANPPPTAWNPSPSPQPASQPTSRSQLSSKNYKFKAYEGNGSRSVVPRLDFEVRYNIFSWSSARLVFHNFGSRMKFRIDCYLVVIFCFMAVLMIDLLLSIYGITSDMNTSSSATLLRPVFWQTLLCVLFCFLLMIFNLLFLFLANSQMKRQRGTLSLLILAKYRYINELETYYLFMSSAPSHPTSQSNPSASLLPALAPINIPLHQIPSVISDQHDLISSLEDLLTVYENIDEIKASKLAGFTIERQHIAWIITTLTLFLYSLYQYFVH